VVRAAGFALLPLEMRMIKEILVSLGLLSSPPTALVWTEFVWGFIFGVVFAIIAGWG
jgi:hypothetical protein